MSAEGYEPLIRRYYEEVWSRGNEAVADDLAAELISPAEIHHTHESQGPGGPERDTQDARRFHAAFPDVHFTIEVVVNGGELIAVFWRAQGTHAATDRPVSNYTGVNIFRFANDQVVEVWNVRDDLGLFAQLGLIPPRSELQAQAAYGHREP
jgi:predicted ester cyclase